MQVASTPKGVGTPVEIDLTLKGITTQVQSKLHDILHSWVAIDLTLKGITTRLIDQT